MENPVFVGTALIVTVFGMMTIGSVQTGNARKVGEVNGQRLP